MFRDLHLPVKLVRQWFVSYIGNFSILPFRLLIDLYRAELLHRRKLWSCANEVILASPDEAIAQMNQVEVYHNIVSVKYYSYYQVQMYYDSRS